MLSTVSEPGPACAELEAQAIAEILQEADGAHPQRQAPGAGRRAVKRLEVIQSLDAASLDRLGGADTECSICR